MVHHIPKKISEIKNSDSKISLIGKIIQADENSFILDDDSGKIEIFSEQAVETNKLVKVFCSVIEGRLKADVVQSLNGFDINLYNKVKELYRRVGL